MALVFGFVIRCELFHSDIGSVFASYPVIRCHIEGYEFQSFIADMERDAADSGAFCFFVRRELESRLEQRLIIYTNDEEVKTALKKTNCFAEGTYQSLLSGTSEIVFLPLADYSYDQLNASPDFCVIGSSGEDVALYNALREKYDVSYPQIIEADEADTVVVVWSMIAIFMILMSGSTVLRRKKETLLRAVYGEDLAGIAVRSMVEDLVIYELLYVLAKLFVSAFISGDYKPELAFGIFEAGCIAAAALNLLYLKYDVRAVFSNVVDNSSALTLLYILKTAAFAIAVFAVSVNFSSLQRTLLSSGSDKLYSLFHDGMLLMAADERAGAEDRELTGVRDVWGRLYEESYDAIHPVVSIMIAEAEHPFILMNEFAAPLLPENLDMTDAGMADVTILYPEDFPVAEEDIRGLLRIFLGNFEEVQWQSKAYAVSIKVPFVSTDQMAGFSEASNPVIIYCRGNARLNNEVFADNRDVIYDISPEELASLDESMGISAQGFRFISTNMGEFYHYKMSFVIQLVRFLSSLCVLVLLLNLSVTVALCGMEYRIFGMEYAIKKIFGYSMIGKNKRQLLKSNAANLGLIVLLAASGGLTGLYSPVVCFLAGLIMAALENSVMVFQILKLERISVAKILKGGCL